MGHRKEAFVLMIKRLRPGAVLPRKASPGATGLDIHACLEQGELELGHYPTLVPTGIAVEFEPGLDVQVRPRSGLAAKGVGVVLGTIDSDYRGELMVTMYLMGGRDSYLIKHEDRIAQLVVSRAVEVDLIKVSELSHTERGTGGHGSTGN